MKQCQNQLIGYNANARFGTAGEMSNINTNFHSVFKNLLS